MEQYWIQANADNNGSSINNAVLTENAPRVGYSICGFLVANVLQQLYFCFTSWLHLRLGVPYGDLMSEEAFDDMSLMQVLKEKEEQLDEV